MILTKKKFLIVVTYRLARSALVQYIKTGADKKKHQEFEGLDFSNPN